MSKKSNVKTVSIFLLKMTVNAFVLAVFIVVFSKRYLGLTFISRTFLITCGTFLITTFLMTSVYGALDIGIKKSKPILHSMALNLFITDIITFVSLKIMGVHDLATLSGDALALLIVLVVQIVFVKVVVSIANSIYFKITVPEKTIIIHNDSRHLTKITHYLKRHAKQYQIIEVLEQDSILSTDFTPMDRIILLDLDHEHFVQCIEKCYLLDINIMYNANLYDVIKKPKSSFVIDDILMYELSAHKLTFFQTVMKRLIDIMVSFVALFMLSPVMILIAIMVKTNDKGPVFYTQDRLTKDGNIFKVYKFRSMRMDSGDKPVSVDDDRITKVGKFIRKFRIDELPQLLNIIIGDMSVVGPRPESVYMTHQINSAVPEFGFRLKVKGGLTGYAQIFGKYNTHPMDKLILDLEYIENFSIMNDIKLMFQTLIVFIKKDSTEAFEADGEQS